MTHGYDPQNFRSEADRRQADIDQFQDLEHENQQDGEHDGDHRQRREKIDSFEKMKVWQEAHALALKIFAATPKLPAEQQAGLALQMEQAAVSVPRSIAEGFKRRGPRNKAHFYNISQTSLEGLRYYLILCRDLKYDIDYDDLAYRSDQVSRMLDGLIRSMLR
jgi:four helix bundle protein